MIIINNECDTVVMSDKISHIKSESDKNTIYYKIYAYLNNGTCRVLLGEYFECERVEEILKCLAEAINKGANYIMPTE